MSLLCGVITNMINQSKKIQDSIDEVAGLADLIKTYQQMAAQKMVEIQKKIASTRDYYQGLAKVSLDVGLDIDSIDKEKPKAILLLAADSRMYGDLLDRVFTAFLESVKNNAKAEVFVYGKIGAQMMTMVMPEKKFTEIGLEEVKKIVETRRVEIFHGEYKNLAYQEVSSSSIEGMGMTSDTSKIESLKLKYFYEPSITDISEVFRNNLTSGLVWFTLNQSEMALSAARVIHLEKAISNTETALTKLRKMFFYSNRKVLQRKMMHQYQIVKMKK